MLFSDVWPVECQPDTSLQAADHAKIAEWTLEQQCLGQQSIKKQAVIFAVVIELAHRARRSWVQSPEWDEGSRVGIWGLAKGRVVSLTRGERENKGWESMQGCTWLLSGLTGAGWSMLWR